MHYNNALNKFIVMKSTDKIIKANTTIKVETTAAAVRYMRMAKDSGAEEIRDNETRQKGGRKYEMKDGEIIYIYAV